jgi:hypothetical protein
MNGSHLEIDIGLAPFRLIRDLHTGAFSGLISLRL